MQFNENSNLTEQSSSIKSIDATDFKKLQDLLTDKTITSELECVTAMAMKASRCHKGGAVYLALCEPF